MKASTAGAGGPPKTDQPLRRCVGIGNAELEVVGWRANARESWMERRGGSLGVLGKSVNTNCLVVQPPLNAMWFSWLPRNNRLVRMGSPPLRPPRFPPWRHTAGTSRQRRPVAHSDRPGRRCGSISSARRRTAAVAVRGPLRAGAGLCRSGTEGASHPWVNGDLFGGVGFVVCRRGSGNSSLGKRRRSTPGPAVT